MSEDDEPQRKKIKRTDMKLRLKNLDKIKNRCHDVLSKLKKAIEDEIRRKPNSMMKELSEEVSCLEEKFTFPETRIALIGSTGVGKSSLINAILDHKKVLPTSGNRACTSVVIEIMENTVRTDFEAEIVFLDKQEWKNELPLLVQDLRNQDDQIGNCTQDTGNEYSVSYAKIQAVYGGDIEITNAEDLWQLTSPITESLGKVEKIKCASADELSEKIAIFIEADESNTSGQYWPIVKQVVLKLPNCDVCSSGAILVDLPGVGDSNVARNQKSEEYVKYCTVLWVVSAIKRASDDQVAMNLMDESFRHQLHMDGKNGTSDSLAFICTMTDDVIPSEIVRTYKLHNQTREYEEKIKQINGSKTDIGRKFKADETRWKRELGQKIKEKQKLLNDKSEYLKQNLNSFSSREKDNDNDIKSKDEHIVKLQKDIKDLSAEKENQDTLLDIQLADYEKELKAICARERNRKSKTLIQQHFKEGLMEQRRQQTDDGNEDSCDGEDIYKPVDNLTVFCCSSVEYQKIKCSSTVDGKPKVFNSPEDTEIPDLRNYVHTVMSRRKLFFVERLICSFSDFMYGLPNYMFDKKSTNIESFLRVNGDFDEKLENCILKKLPLQIDTLFNDILYKNNLERTEEADRNGCSLWRMPVNTYIEIDRCSVGLDWETNTSAVDKYREYLSNTYTIIDFNCELSRFIGFLSDWAEIFKDSSEMLMKMQLRFLAMLDESLQKPVTDADGLSEKFINTYSHFTDGLKKLASWKLTEMKRLLRDKIMKKHLEMCRKIKPYSQSNLLEPYNARATEFGYLFLAVETKCDTIFDVAAKMVMKDLNELKTFIIKLVESTYSSLVVELRNSCIQYKMNSHFTVGFVQTVKWVNGEMDSIRKEAGMQHKEETNQSESAGTTLVGVGRPEAEIR